MSNDVPIPLPIDAYIVGRDETGNYNIAAVDKPHIERIVGVYLLDRNSKTNCCEIVPSYFLIHLYDSVWVKENGKLDDDERERLCERYESLESEDIYVHCRLLNAVLDAGKEARNRNDQAARLANLCYHDGETGIDFKEESYEEQMERLREHFCGNHVL